MVSSAAYDWVKNCACIADFYQSMDKQQIAALALSSAQKVLQEKVILKSTVAAGAATGAAAAAGGAAGATGAAAAAAAGAAGATGAAAAAAAGGAAGGAAAAAAAGAAAAGGGGGGVTEQDCIELNCEIKKKWIKLDMKMMKIAFEVETERVLAIDRGEPFSPPTYENDLDDLHMFQEPGSEIPDKKQCELLSSSDVILEGAVVDQSTSSVTTLKEVCYIVYLLLENSF
jgi:hypothetical protein